VLYGLGCTSMNFGFFFSREKGGVSADSGASPLILRSQHLELVRILQDCDWGPSGRTSSAKRAVCVFSGDVFG